MRYKPLGCSGILVSELALGTGTFGTAWPGGADRGEARRIFDGFAQAGGNFIDCAEGYQNGEAEAYIGEFLRAERDHFVIGTKFSGGTGPGASLGTTGNSRKAMARALEGSLKRLQTDRVDILSVHFPDGVTPVDEIMRGFEDLVRAGKTITVGFSDFPAWRVARAATLAECRDQVRPAAIQIEYSLVERTAERELLPMAQGLGLVVTIWLPLAGGLLTGKYRRAEEGRLTRGGGLVRVEEGEREGRILDCLEAVAQELEATPAQVAIAWIRARGVQLGSTLIPILGARTRAQFDDTIGALRLALSAEQMTRLNAASAVSLGFPHDLLSSEMMAKLRFAGRSAEIDRPIHPVA